MVLLAFSVAGAVCVGHPGIYKVRLPLAGSFRDRSSVTEYLDHIFQHFLAWSSRFTLVVQGVDFHMQV